eukprot:m.979966 g.979966  ORF g.979966 m.979966 type:complete len:166 (+) comp23962_c0_seq15:176-673(+)
MGEPSVFGTIYMGSVNRHAEKRVSSDLVNEVIRELVRRDSGTHRTVTVDNAEDCVTVSESVVIKYNTHERQVHIFSTCFALTCEFTWDVRFQMCFPMKLCGPVAFHAYKNVNVGKAKTLKKISCSRNNTTTLLSFMCLRTLRNKQLWQMLHYLLQLFDSRHDATQ